MLFSDGQKYGVLSRKLQLTVELDADILEWFKAESEDWEARVQTHCGCMLKPIKHICRLRKLPVDKPLNPSLADRGGAMGQCSGSNYEAMEEYPCN